MNFKHTLLAVPDGIFSVNYTVYENDVEVAKLYRKLMSARLKGSITTNGITRQVYRTGWFSSTFIMESVTGLGEAIAKRLSWFSASFNIDYLGNSILLKKKYWTMKEKYLLIQDGKEVGMVWQPKVFSRKLELITEVEIPIEVRAFILWLTIVLIAANSSDSSSNGASGMS